MLHAGSTPCQHKMAVTRGGDTHDGVYKRVMRHTVVHQIESASVQGGVDRVSLGGSAHLRQGA
jgi:hypothetical protein